MISKHSVGYAALTALVVFITGCGGGATPVRQADVPQGAIKPDDLVIVHCLLPSQVRQLGEGFTYLAPRRPVKTTAQDCARKGGEYIAYDRANLANSLKFWLPAAQGGDVAAMVNVGELYENGRGVEPDYQQALLWYQKAAEKGDSRAMLNLGNLYESGRGVPQDMTQAMNWYRKASGLTGGELEFSTDQQIAERRAKAQEADRLRTEVLELRRQLTNSQRALSERESALNQTREQLRQAQANAAQADAAKVRELTERLRTQEGELAQFQRATEELLAQMGTRGPVAQAATAATSGPVIAVISPQVAPTRAGVDAAVVFDDVPSYDVIGRITPVSDLLALKINDRDARELVDENGIFQVPVPIAAGQTPVRIEAISKDGRRSSQNFLLSKEPLEPIARRNVSRQLLRRLQTDLGTFHALVIGNNSYQSFPTLNSAVTDATKIGQLLSQRYGYQVQVLNNANKLQIMQALAKYTETLGANDNLLIYWAGHGVIDNATGRGYWVPVDGNADYKDSLLSNEQITTYLSTIQARHVLVVADSCYSGTLSGAAITPIPVDAADDDLLFVSRTKARTVLTSGGLQPVQDQGGGQHSVFASAFIQALEQNQNLLEGYTLYREVRQRLGLQANVNLLNQRPEYSALKHAGHEGSEFFFVPRDAT